MEQSELESCYCSPVGGNSVAFSTLLENIKKMSKNVTIEADLAEVLNEFLKKLTINDKYIEHGICNTNFAEAALFLQNTTDLYGKKVDLLWDIIMDYQKRIVCYGKNDEKQKQLKKIEERRMKYKRKRKTETNQLNDLVNNYSFGVQTEICDYLNNYEYDQHNLLNKWKTFNQENIQEDTIHIKNSNALFLPNDQIYSLDDNEFIGVYDQFHSFSLPELFCPSKKLRNERVKIPFNEVSSNKEINKSCFVRLEQLPIEEMYKLRKFSRADSLLEKSVMADCMLDNEKSEGSLSQDSAFFDCETDNNQSTNESMPNLGLCASSAIIIPKCKKLKLCLSPEETKRKVKKILKNRKTPKSLLKLCGGVSANYWNFEKFYRRGYKHSEGEGNPASDIESDSDGEDNTDKTMPNDHINRPETGIEIINDNIECENERNLNNLNTSDYNSDLNETDPLEPKTTNNELMISSIDEIRSEEKSRETVLEWRKYILPKLKPSENKSDFDIHFYGTNLIENTQNNKNPLFKEIVKDKSASEIARYFTVALHLANAGNLELLGGKCNGNETSNDTLQLKLLNDKLLYETLIDYHAPSEETFNERLQLAQELNPTINLHSTPFSSPSPKRRKFTFVKKKKISFND